MKSADDVLRFWFGDHGQEDWFGGKAEFDAEIAEQFGETHAAAARGEAWRWRTTPAGRLAEIIVLDQFSRQLHRGDARAFASDGMALVLAQEAVAAGHHSFVPQQRRMFFLMPYMHAESAEVQAESLRLFTALGSPELTKFAQGHADCVRRFGRFPKRNTALGRASTPDEINYIAETAGMF